MVEQDFEYDITPQKMFECYDHHKNKNAPVQQDQRLKEESNNEQQSRKNDTPKKHRFSTANK